MGSAQAKESGEPEPPAQKVLTKLLNSPTKLVQVTTDVLGLNHGAAADFAGQHDEAVISALKSLRAHLPHLTPAAQQNVKNELPFASAEWLDGLAIATRIRDDGSGKSVSSSSFNSLHNGSLRGGSLHGGLVRTPIQQRRAKDGPGMPRAESIDEMSERMIETANDARIRLTPDSGRLILVLVGLPARGKSMLGYKLERFLGWRGYKTKHFKVGQKRRDVWNKDGERTPQASASFFDTSKAYAAMTREALSLQAFDELLEWIETDDGQVAIFDASNVTIMRRSKLTEKVNALNAKGSTSAGIVFIESVVTDPEVVTAMSLWKVRHSADFKGLGELEALKDLEERICHYEKQYQTVREAEGPYIKMFDLRAKVHACNVYGRMAKSVLPYLLAIHGIARPIFMLVVDEAYSYVDHNGGSGNKSALQAGLAKWVRSYPRAAQLLILTSAQPRAVETAEALADAAGCERPGKRGPMTPLLHSADTKAAHAEKGDEGTFEGKFGETVENLVGRLEPTALEMEAAVQPVFLVAHEACCRTLRTLLMEQHIPFVKARETVNAKSTVTSPEPEAPTILEFYPIESGGYSETVHVLSKDWAAKSGGLSGLGGLGGL